VVAIVLRDAWATYNARSSATTRSWSGSELILFALRWDPCICNETDSVLVVSVKTQPCQKNTDFVSTGEEFEKTFDIHDNAGGGPFLEHLPRL